MKTKKVEYHRSTGYFSPQTSCDADVYISTNVQDKGKGKNKAKFHPTTGHKSLEME